MNRARKWIATLSNTTATAMMPITTMPSFVILSYARTRTLTRGYARRVVREVGLSSYLVHLACAPRMLNVEP